MFVQNVSNKYTDLYLRKAMLIYSMLNTECAKRIHIHW